MNIKEKIIKTAMKLFYEQGIQNTGINQIIREANIAKGSLYRHFSSKDELVKECLAEFEKYIHKTLMEVVSTTYNFKEFSEQWVKFMKRDFGSIYRGCPIAESAYHIVDSNVEIQKQIKEIFAKYQEILSQIFSRMKKSALLSENTDTDLLAQRIIHLYEGALAMYRMTRDMKYIEDLKELMPAVYQYMSEKS